MGKTFMGNTSRGEDVNLLNPQQQQYLSTSGETFSQMANPDMGQMDAVFQKSYIDPAMKAFNQQIVPGLQEQLGESSASGALNRALAGAAGDISTGLGQQYGDFYKQQQQQGAQGLAGLSQQRTFEPTFNSQQGILGPIIGALGQTVGGDLSGGGTVLKQIMKILGIG